MQNIFTVGITHTWDTLAHAKWIGSCPSCGHTIKAHRRIDRSCSQCDRRYNPKYRLIYCPNPDSLTVVSDR